MSKSFDNQKLFRKLDDFPHPRSYLVGFSGGADSTALLQALCELGPELNTDIEAIHFNHGIHQESGSWQRHCERFCKERNVRLTIESLSLGASGANRENNAREMRYRIVAHHLNPHAIYLTAHTADDQAETLILHAMRGSGVEGLAGIPEIRPLAGGHVVRPLLGFSRQALEAYLMERGVDWIEDPSNLDVRHDRNFVRHHVMPLLKSRWPSARESLARSARHLRATVGALEALLARIDLQPEQDGGVQLQKFYDLGPENMSVILRWWLKQENAPPVPQSRLIEFIAQITSASRDAHCETTWAGWAVRYYNDQLFLLPPPQPPDCPEKKWTGPALSLGPEVGTLRLVGGDSVLPSGWTVGPRRPGTRIQLRSGGPRRKLKKIFQEQNIPPWQRESIPVLYWGDEAVAVGDWMKAPRLRGWLADAGLQYRWDPAHPDLVRLREICLRSASRAGLA